jgi:hypothetical protein
MKALRHRFERSAMNRTRPVLMQFNQMHSCAVAFVLAEAIFGKRGEVLHTRVARDFGNHTRRRTLSGKNACDDAVCGSGKGKRETVDQHVVGLQA